MKQRIAFKDLGITSTPWKKCLNCKVNPAQGTLCKDCITMASPLNDFFGFKNQPIRKTLDEKLPSIIVQEPAEKCVKCGSENLELIQENNGFTLPQGPTKIEIVGVACLDCGHKEYD